MAKNEISFDSWIPIRRDHRLFTTLYDLTILMGALGVAFRGLGEGKIEYEDNAVMVLKAPISGRAYGISMFKPLQAALWDLPFDQNAIGILDRSDVRLDPSTEVTTGGLSAPVGHIVGSIFLRYFEPYNEWLTAELAEAKNWPPTLNFARVARNSVAHGGINIRNPRADPVTWLGLTYGPNDNGKNIIPSIVGPGDVITLLLDTCADLDALSAPIL